MIIIKVFDKYSLSGKFLNFYYLKYYLNFRQRNNIHILDVD